MGTTAIGNATTADLNFNSTVYSFDGSTTIKAATGDTIDVTGGVTSFTTDGDNISFAVGNIALTNGSNLTIDTGAAGGDITIGGEIAGASQETVTIDAGTGATSVGVIGTSTEIGTLTIGSAQNGAITLNGAIITDGVVTIDGPVTLATGAVSVTTANDAITFAHTIDGTQALALASGSAATKLDGEIGGNAALSSLTVNAAGTGTLEIADIGGVTGTTAIGNTNTGTVTLDGTAYSTAGTQTYTAATGGGNIDITNASGVTFTTTNTNILLSLIHI